MRQAELLQGRMEIAKEGEGVRVEEVRVYSARYVEPVRSVRSISACDEEENSTRPVSVAGLPPRTA